MAIFRIKIDEKSLYYGFHNDYSKGHSSTVHTPINQSKNQDKWHQDIISFLRADSGLEEIPSDLIDCCTKKTTSKANCRINHFYEFKRIMLDGKDLDSAFSFGIYVKEETDEKIKDRKGKIVVFAY